DDGSALSRPTIPEEKKITVFTLFLGVFSKSEIADIRRHWNEDVLATELRFGRSREILSTAALLEEATTISNPAGAGISADIEAVLR
ncbi:hypothetical protein AB9F35_34660, partial [Rhizobium leguminosarum]|uniref:hypothetical protein n=1 Tax=Rhizobium leguminosarum TaxID=384 RepID=UPI003F9E5F8E